MEETVAIPEPVAPAEATQPAPPAPPREVTPAIRRRAWTEPRVRLWWLLALGVLAITLYVAGAKFAEWWVQRRLLTDGAVVQAVVVQAVNEQHFITLPGKKMPPDSVCTLEFQHAGKTYKVVGQLIGHIERGEHIITGPDDPVTLRIDPDDPTARWTDRTSPPPLLSRQVVGASVGLPLVLLLGVLAFVKRRGATEAWRRGVASPALVVGTGQTPVAPRSRSVKCTSASDTSDKRVFTVYLPPVAGSAATAVAPGDTVWVLHPPGRPEPAYAVGWFVREESAS